MVRRVTSTAPTARDHRITGRFLHKNVPRSVWARSFICLQRAGQRVVWCRSGYGLPEQPHS
jgi:hypothetical protein